MWYSVDVSLCVQDGEVDNILLAQQVSLEVITTVTCVMTTKLSCVNVCMYFCIDVGV